MEQVVRVLHVDDEPEFTDLSATVLEDATERFQVTTATSAKHGLERLDDAVFDCVVSDYQMPRMDGIEFLRAVRETHPDLPFVLFTGRGSEEVASDAISAGATDYIQKRSGTSQFELLANRVENAVERYRARKRAARIEQEHRIVAEMSTDVFYVVDMETGDVRYSDGIAQFGYDPDDIDPDIEWWTERVHPDDSERMALRHEAAAEPNAEGFDEFTGERGRIESEYRWRRADGSYAHLVGRGITLFEDGEAVKQIGTMEDVTDQRERRGELERYETIVENCEEGIVVFDADGTFAFVNRRVLDVTDTTRDDWLGEHVSVAVERGMLTDEEAADVETAIEAVVGGDAETVRVEVTPQVPGSNAVIELRLTPYRDAADVERVIGFSRARPGRDSRT